MKLWGGRFDGALHPAFDAFNRSLPFDRRLWAEDICGSQAWADAQVAAGTLKKSEAEKLVAALGRLAHELQKSKRLLDESEAEDIHSFVEAWLVNELGDLGKKLHAGRSRNDQVATDLLLYLKIRIPELEQCLHSLMLALAELANREHATAMPGYTHLQRAQIITAGHHALAYVEMLERDCTRLADAAQRLDRCPLGSGALAGSGIAVDRKELAKDLGFAAPTRNSLDAVSDRDFVAELLFVATLSGTHLSRLAEDWIFYTSQEAGFLELSDEVTTGSSLMPHKKNPDSLELIRGKGARLLGRLTGFLSCLRSLPLAYDKDLQEDKEAIFDTLDNWEACLIVARLAVQGARFDRVRCLAACEKGFLNATELAQILVQDGVPFRDAHEKVGVLVRLAMAEGKELTELSTAEIAQVLPSATTKLLAALSVKRILNKRSVLGSANPKLVRREARRWIKVLQKRAQGKQKT